MGARGPLKIVSPLQPVTEALANTVAAQTPANAPVKPSAVARDAELSEMWDEVVPELDAAGLLSRVDAFMIEAALRHFRKFRRADDEAQSISEMGARGGLYVNPAITAMNSQSRLFLEYAKAMGMTFMSRARTASLEAVADGDNPFAPGLYDVI